MFNPTRTIIEMEMDRFQPSINRNPGPVTFNPALRRETPQYLEDVYGNIYDTFDHKQEPKYKTDMLGSVYDSSDHYCMKPIGSINMGSDIIDPIRPYPPIGTINNSY